MRKIVVGKGWLQCTMKALMHGTLLFTVLGMGGESYAQGISVSPSRIFYKGLPGHTLTESVTFTNNSSTAFNFTSSLKDWERDSIGQKRYFAPGSLDQSNSNWIKLSESTVSLKPGETKKVMIALTVPKDTPIQKLTNSMVFFTQMKEQRQRTEDQKQVGVNVLLEVGIQVYHIPQGLSGGDLEFLAFEDRGKMVFKSDTMRQMAIKVKNVGEVNKDAYIRFELTNMATGEEIPIASTAIAMLPDAEQWVYVELPGELKGRYLAVAILDAGRQYELRVAEKEITY